MVMTIQGVFQKVQYSLQRMQSSATTVVTTSSREPEEPAQQEQLVLRLRPPASPPHVTWAEGVVDNEHMGRLKSNCCCIYVAPRRWDDPSTWEPDEHETEHCRGHTLPEKKNKKQGDEDEDGEEGDGGEEKKSPDEKDGGCGCDHC